MTKKTLEILIIDDDDVSQEQVVRSLRKVNPEIKLVSAFDGQEGLDILRGIHETKSILKPYLVLLDLNMPGMNGFEFLDEIRKDKKLSDTVIFVLTTSQADMDISGAYQRYVAAYMVKHAIGEQFSKLASLLHSYNDSVHLPN